MLESLSPRTSPPPSETTISATKLKDSQKTNIPSNPPPPNNKPLRISTFNARSFQSLSKLKEALSGNPDILCVQEIWNHAEKEKFFVNSISRTRSPHSSHGGGVMTAWNNTVQLLSTHKIGQDSLLTRFNLNNHIPLYVLNIYRSNSDPWRKILTQLYTIIPSDHLSNTIAVGDFNLDLSQDSKELRAFKSVCKSMNVSIFHHEQPTRGLATLDFLIAGKNIECIAIRNVPTSSDHSLVTFDLRIKNTSVKNRQLLPNAALGKTLTVHCLNNTHNSIHFLSTFNQLRSENKNRLVITPRKRLYLNETTALLFNSDADPSILRNHYWRYIVTKIEALRYSLESRTAFSLMDRIYKFHLRRRDGEIIWQIQLPDGLIIQNPNAVMNILTDQLSKIQCSGKDLPPVLFPRLPPSPTMIC